MALGGASLRHNQPRYNVVLVGATVRHMTQKLQMNVFHSSYLIHKHTCFSKLYPECFKRDSSFFNVR